MVADLAAAHGTAIQCFLRSAAKARSSPAGTAIRQSAAGRLSRRTSQLSSLELLMTACPSSPRAGCLEDRKRAQISQSLRFQLGLLGTGAVGLTGETAASLAQRENRQEFRTSGNRNGQRSASRTSSVDGGYGRTYSECSMVVHDHLDAPLRDDRALLERPAHRLEAESVLADAGRAVSDQERIRIRDRSLYRHDQRRSNGRDDSRGTSPRPWRG